MAISIPSPVHNQDDTLYRIKTIDDNVVISKKIIVHTFTVGDSEDPDLYAAEPLYAWEKSDAGKWVMEHSTETPVWHRNFDLNCYSYRYIIVAWLTEQDRTFFELKYR